MRNIIKKILRETEFDWLPIQNEIGLEVRIAGTDFTTPVTMPLKGPRDKCGRWFTSVPENAYKEETDSYEVPISMDGTKVKWLKEIDGYEFLNMSFIDDTSNLFESEDDFNWVEDLGKDTIKKGDVFYIIDGIYEENVLPLDYKPENVRYLFHVTDVFERSGRFFLEYHYCNPEDVTYNPKDYNKNSCYYESYDVYGTEIEYERALELINYNYWRLMGNNGYYDNV